MATPPTVVTGSWWLQPMTRAQFDAEVATRFAVNRAEAKERGFAVHPYDPVIVAARKRAQQRGARHRKMLGSGLGARV